MTKLKKKQLEWVLSQYKQFLQYVLKDTAELQECLNFQEHAKQFKGIKVLSSANLSARYSVLMDCLNTLRKYEQEASQI